jgi:folate-dependent phosphoribosylglycinamide formyltransferase PurN
MGARVVVLSKRHPLTSHLESRLASAGMLAGVVYETRLDGWRGPVRYVQRLAKREGMMRAADVVAYELYDRIIRSSEFDRAVATLAPIDPSGAAPAASVPRTDVANLNAPEARAAIAALAPDFLVVHGTAILKPETFGIARVAAFNIHCGILPEYRGHASTFWALAKGDRGNVGVTVHHVAAGVDTGLLVRQGRVPWARGENDITMWIRALALGADLVVDAVHEWERAGTVASDPYVGAKGPHYRRKGMTDYLRYRLTDGGR